MSSSAVASYILGSSLAQNDTWPEQYGNNQNAGFANHGPMSSSVAFIYSGANGISAGPVVAYGKVFIAGADTVYAISATTGALSWKYTGGNTILNMLTEGGSVVVNNGTNLIKLNAANGNVIWQSTPTTEPITKIIYSDAGLIIGIDESTSLYAYSASNGTHLKTFSNIDTGFGSIAMDYGSIAEIAAGTPKIKLFNIAGSNFSKIWQSASTYTGANTNLATSGSFIGFYAATTFAPGILYINGSVLGQSYTQVSGGGNIYGIAYGDGAFVYQSTGGIEAISPTSNSVLWNTAVASPLSNSGGLIVPSIGGNAVYSEWSGSDILAQNMTNGQTLWTATTPYSLTSPGPTSGFPPTNDIALAYGRLYATTSNGVLALGPCPSNANASVLLEAATLYLNGFGSCADYMLNYISSMSNYTVYINNIYAPGISSANFSSARGSYVEISPSNTLSSPLFELSISFWAKVNNNLFSGNAPSSPVMFGDRTATSGYDVYLWDSAPNQNEFTVSAGTGSSYLIGYTLLSPTILPNPKQWNLYTVTVNNGEAAFYINGKYIGNDTVPGWGAISENPSLPFYIGSFTSPVPNYSLNGSIANLQVYNTTLSNAQVESLYLGGISGPAQQDAGLLAWYPLSGDANDYSGNFNTGFPVNLAYQTSNFTPMGMGGAYEVSKSSSLFGLTNFTTGKAKLYNVSVVTWR